MAVRATTVTEQAAPTPPDIETDTVAAAPPAQIGASPANDETPPGQRQLIIDVLRREMDRCDRYHTVFALAAFWPELPPDPGGDLIRGLARRLATKVRSSDYVACLDDGTVLMIAPEDIQSLGRMQQRERLALCIQYTPELEYNPPAPPGPEPASLGAGAPAMLPPHE